MVQRVTIKVEVLNNSGSKVSAYDNGEKQLVSDDFLLLVFCTCFRMLGFSIYQHPFLRL